MPRVYIHIREQEADFLLFDGTRFLLGATHQWHAQDDIKYHLFNIMDVYGLDPRNVQVSLSGLRDLKSSLMKDLRKDVTYVMLTMLPSVARRDIPLSAALLIRN